MEARQPMPSPATHQRLTARVTGRVQGVYFRAFTRRQAQALALRGWVRNEPGGSVHLVAEGPRAALEALLDAVRRGPPDALVEHVAVGWTEATGAFDGFSVER